MPSPAAPWKVWIDTGGTFTDCVAVAPDGSVRRAKVLSSGAIRVRVEAVEAPGTLVVSPPAALPSGLLEGARAGAGPARVVSHTGPPHRIVLDPPPETAPAAGEAVELLPDEPAPVVAARVVTGTPRRAPLPPMEMRLGTTLATNALLERRGARVVLCTTRGLGDLLEIGDQRRPDLFALAITKPAPLAEAVVEVPGRLAADGTELEAHDLGPVEERLAELAAGGCRAAAVALLHGYLVPGLEEHLADRLRELGFRYVACSARLAPEIRLLPRATTAVVDAYVGPVVGAYLERVRSAAGKMRLHVMTSAGGLVAADRIAPKDTLLSGPAAGVVGAAAAARSAGLERVVTFDMGGTSTDVARWDGDLEYRFEHTVGPATLLAPAVALETVAAGGGSVCSFDGHRLRVGPESAGADPGPACYGAGGPLALTDVNLLLGRLDAEGFGIPVSPRAARRALNRILEALAAAGRAEAPEAVLGAFLDIADERMAEAIRRISVHRGADPAEYALVAFGGAGGQHACAVAGLLGMRTVLVPADAGLLSAHGLGRAPVERFAHREVLEPLGRVRNLVPGWLEELAAAATAAVAGEGVQRDRIVVRLRLASLRLAGQEATLEVDAEPVEGLAARFLEAFAGRYGFRPPEARIELASLRVVAASRPAPPPPSAPPAPALSAVPRTHRRVWFGGRWRRVPLLGRERLEPGHRLAGPALVVEPHSATVVPPGWHATVLADGALLLGRRR